jgi:hypothetical protein
MSSNTLLNNIEHGIQSDNTKSVQLDNTANSAVSEGATSEGVVTSLMVIKKTDDDVIIYNPFIRKVKVNDQYLHETNMVDLYRTYDRLLIVCIKNTEDIDLRSILLQMKISKNTLNKYGKSIVVIDGTLRMLNNGKHKNDIVCVPKEYLDLLDNKHDVKFEETELVLPLFHVDYQDTSNYIKQYNGYFDIKDYIKVKLLNNFYQNNQSSEIVRKNMQLLLSELNESKYWEYYYNCRPNLTLQFLERGFNLVDQYTISDDKIKRILKKVNELPLDNNYLNFIYRKQVFVDASNAIKKNGFKLYRIQKYIDEDITINEMNELIDSAKNKYELYNLIMSLLTSKKYCHLVLNNLYVIDKLNDKELFNSSVPEEHRQSLLDRFIPVFRYAIGYAWLTLYLEECIKKTHTTRHDRYVFNINTASKLPIFPFSQENIRHNPYVSLLVSDKALDSKTNNIGLGYIKGNDYGINTLDDFRTNFNLFTTKNSNTTIFQDLDWTNLAVSGSIMTACIPKNNPLLQLFKEDDIDKRKLRFYDEYYVNSDIDMMCNIKDSFEYIDKVYKVLDTVKKNVLLFNKTDDVALDASASEENIKITAFKSTVLIVDDRFIKNNIVTTAMKMDDRYTFEYIIKHLGEEAVKSLFYCRYIEDKSKDNERFMDTDKWTNPRYKEYFDFMCIKDLRIILVENAKSVEESNELFRIGDNLKFKITSPYLPHSVEVFQTKYEPFFSCVSRFHLPCVRAYYDGTDVYLLPSAITAYMTYMNIDYKYFAGTKDPIEIVNKYRMRGFGTYLNDKEKMHLIEYSRRVQAWKELFDIEIKNPVSVKAMLGQCSLHDKLFKPRKYNTEKFRSKIPVTNNYKTEEELNITYVNTHQDIIDEYKRLYNYDENQSDIKYLNYRTIDYTGYIRPIKRWIINSAFDTLRKSYIPVGEFNEVRETTELTEAGEADVIDEGDGTEEATTELVEATAELVEATAELVEATAELAELAEFTEAELTEAELAELTEADAIEISQVSEIEMGVVPEATEASEVNETVEAEAPEVPEVNGESNVPNLAGLLEFLVSN